MIGTISDLPYFYITFKHGLCNPVELNAIDEIDARKRGYAHYLKNSGFVETVNQKFNIDYVVDTVEKLV